MTEAVENACGYFEKTPIACATTNTCTWLREYPIASGVIEGACRHVVVDRMEGSGMRWVIEGAQSMLGLRCSYINGDWDPFMKLHIEQEQRALYLVRAANDSTFYRPMVA